MLGRMDSQNGFLLKIFSHFLYHRRPPLPPSPRPQVAFTNAHPGVGRLAYGVGLAPIVLGWILLLATVVQYKGQAVSILTLPIVRLIDFLFLLTLAVVFVFIFLRFMNIRRNPWWSLLLLVPILGLLVIIAGLFFPPGYAITKKLDMAGKVIVTIILVIAIGGFLLGMVSFFSMT